MRGESEYSITCSITCAVSCAHVSCAVVAMVWTGPLPDVEFVWDDKVNSSFPTCVEGPYVLSCQAWSVGEGEDYNPNNDDIRMCFGHTPSYHTYFYLPCHVIS